jgi:hypothetical protein
VLDVLADHVDPKTRDTEVPVSGVYRTVIPRQSVPSECGHQIFMSRSGSLTLFTRALRAG